MAHNKCPPSSLPPNSRIESSENNPVRFSTLSSNSSSNNDTLMVGAEKEYAVSHTTTTDNDTLIVPTPSPSPAQPSSNRSSVLSQDPREDINSYALVGSKREYMASHTTTTITNNDTLMDPTPSSAQPTFDGFIDLSHNPEDIPASSSKKSRGRPLGSKNRPKPPVIIEEIMDNNMKMIFIEIHAGRDIVGDIINCARRHQASITVLRAFGLVSDVTLLHPKARVPTPPMKGPFEMTSLSGTYVNANCGRVPPEFINDPTCSCFSIKLSGSGAQVYAGIVGGKVIAAGVVLVTATLLKTPEHYQAIPNNNNVVD